MIGGISSDATEGAEGGHVPEPPSSLAQLAALEQLRRRPRNLELAPLLRAVVLEVPRLLVEIADCDVSVHADEEDLRTILRNLLMNVRDHATGRATVAALLEQHRVRIHVADDGPGLRPMQVATLFQRGARGPGSPGLGLGLHVARMLSRRQGGDLSLVRGVGGCTFEILLWDAGGPQEPDALPVQRCGRGATAPAPWPAEACEG